MIKKVSIIIPVYNEARTVTELLETVHNQPLPGNLEKEIIIVESNSKDDSRRLCEQFVQDKKRKNAEVYLIKQTSAKGKGFATREGILAASGDIIMIQDADLEYDVTDYPQLIQPILDGHADFVLGSRHLSAGSWKIRKFEKSPLKAAIMNFGGSLFHFFFNQVYQVKLTDPTTMYKVFRADCIRGVEFESNRFDFDFELVAKLVRLGFAPLEVPITYRSRGFEEGKKVSIWRDPFTYVYAILKFRIKRIKRLPRHQWNETQKKALSRAW